MFVCIKKKKKKKLSANLFLKCPISIIGKMLNIGADNRSTPKSDMTKHLRRDDATPQRTSEEANPQTVYRINQILFPQSVMIWGAMSSAGVGPLCFLKPT